MIIHRQTMLTENDSSEHLLAKINQHPGFILKNHIYKFKNQLTDVHN